MPLVPALAYVDRDFRLSTKALDRSRVIDRNSLLLKFYAPKLVEIGIKTSGWFTSRFQRVSRCPSLLSLLVKQYLDEEEASRLDLPGVSVRVVIHLNGVH